MQIKPFTPFLIVILMMMFIPGCETTKGGADGNSRDGARIPPVVVAVPAQSEAAQDPERYLASTVPVGGSVEVTLPFQAGTGYSWALASHSDGLSLVNTSTRSLSDDGRTGGPMEAIYVLKRTRKNTNPETAVFRLSRPWETDSPAAREVTVQFMNPSQAG